MNNQWSIKNTFLPNDTRELLENKDIFNYNLKLNKAVNFFDDIEQDLVPIDSNSNKIKPKFYKSEYRDKEKNSKKLWIEPDFSYLDFKKISDRHLFNAKTLLGESNIKEFTLSPDWRIIIGLGNESVYETSITLHHIYGIPYIPASAIKGVVRSWIISQCFNNIEGDKSKGALSNKLFCDIFGSPADSIAKEQQGKIIFFDAFPIQAPNIVPDIMNSHYGSYYSDTTNKKPPADYYNPVPVFFLTVKDTPFRFFIGCKNELTEFQKEEVILQDLKELLFFKKNIDGDNKNVCFFKNMDKDKIKKLTFLNKKS